MTSKPNNLESIANKLKVTMLFTGNSDLDRLFDKQQLFLVAAGLIPGCYAVSGHQKKTSTGWTTIPDDSQQVASLLDEIDLFYKIKVQENYLQVAAAKTKVTLKKLLAADYNDSFSLLGIPETAALAFRNKDTLSPEEQDKILQTHVKDKRVIKLFSFFLSKKYYLDEIKEIKMRFHILKKFGLVD